MADFDIEVGYRLLATGELTEDSPPADTFTFAPNTLTWVGFSNTYQVINGYKTLSTANAFYHPTYETGGGSVYRWYSNERGHREIFTNAWEEGWPVWWHLVFRSGEGGQTNYGAQLDVVGEWLRGVVGDDTNIWVSILHDYATSVWPGDGWPDHVIPKADHENYMVQAIENFGCLQGPVNLGPLGPGQLAADNVHPNGAGRAFVGLQLSEFFDPYVET